jgi:hypothetical protein
MADVEWDPIWRVAISPQDKVYDNIAPADDWLAFENLDDIIVPAEDIDQRMADTVPAAEPPTATEVAAGQAMMGEDDENTLGSIRDVMAGKPAPVKENARKKAPSSSAPSTPWKMSPILNQRFGASMLKLAWTLKAMMNLLVLP